MAALWTALCHVQSSRTVGWKCYYSVRLTAMAVMGPLPFVHFDVVSLAYCDLNIIRFSLAFWPEMSSAR